MDKNYPRKSSDRQLESLIRTVIESTILTDEELDEIAESPKLQRRILNSIAVEKSQREKRWFFVWRWQTATAGAFLFLLTAGATVWLFDSKKTEIAAVSDEKTTSVLKNETEPFEIKPETTHSNLNDTQKTHSPTRQKISTVKFEKKPLNSKSLRIVNAPQKAAKVKTVRSPKTEFSTEFIALSYLPASESGQVVRVKVPRSMMVSLGVSTNVERSKELINAEVIVGDDGAARAIRFLSE